MQKVNPIESNPKVTINWGTFNIPTLLALVGAFWAIATGWQKAESRIDALEKSSQLQLASIEKSVDSTSSKVTQIDNISYRLNIAEKSIVDASLRADRTNEQVSARLDRIQDSVNQLTTNLEVLNQHLQSVLPRQHSTPAGRGP